MRSCLKMTELDFNFNENQELHFDNYGWIVQGDQ